MTCQPRALLSYTRFDDQNDGQWLTLFCERLSNEVRAYTGADFPIFQDIKDIQWGQPFQERIDAAIQEITFLIPMLSFDSEDVRRTLVKMGAYGLVVPCGAFLLITISFPGSTL